MTTPEYTNYCVVLNEKTHNNMQISYLKRKSSKKKYIKKITNNIDDYVIIHNKEYKPN
tara:strand:- start:1457 stop:1630 length:174 start_codon:yes stop_codon:yes gene_type:complete